MPFEPATKIFPSDPTVFVITTGVADGEGVAVAEFELDEDD
jgi:hypothetical protein